MWIFFSSLPHPLKKNKKQTCSELVVHGVGNDLVCVVFGFLPGEQGHCAGVRRSSQVARAAGETFFHNDRQPGNGAGCPKPVFSDALIVTCVLQSQLVDEQHPRALHLHSPERSNGLAVLQPVQHWERFPRTVAQKPGGIPPGEGHRLRGLNNHWRGCSKKKVENP